MSRQEEKSIGSGGNGSVIGSLTGSGLDFVSCASGPRGCIASEVLRVRDIDISCAEKTDGDRAGEDLRFQNLVAVRPKGVEL